MPFSDYVLSRQGTTPTAAVRRLRHDGSVRALADVAALDEALDEAAAAVSAALHTAVPLLPEPARRAALRARRLVHNGRAGELVERAVAGTALPPSAEAALASWLELRRRRDTAAEAAGRLLDAALADGRRTLASLLEGDLLDGLLLSGRHAYAAVAAYRQAVLDTGGRAAGKTLRAAEKTLLGYLCRTAYKPTPFGSFTEVAAQAWAAPGGAPGPRIRRASLNRGLLAWMAGESAGLAGAERVVTVRLNNTVRVGDGTVTYFRRGRDGRPDGMGGERFVSLPVSPAVRLVVDLLRAQPVRRADLVADLAAKLPPRPDRAGAARQEAEAFLERLVEAGLCEADLGIADQEPRYAEAAARLLRTADTDACSEAAALFERLQYVEDRFPGAGPRTRAGLLDEIDRHKRTFITVARLDPRLTEFDAARTMMFEDVGRAGPVPGWDAAAVNRLDGAFATLGRVLPLLDDATVVRIGLFRHFTSVFGGSAGPVPLLAFYRSVMAGGPAGVSEVMTAVGDPAAAVVRRLRRELLARVRASATVSGPGGIPEARLDHAWLAEFAAALPAHVPPWRSFGARVQFAAGPQGPLVVLNQTVTGHGALYSRFCDLLPPERDGWSLRSAVTAAIGPRRMDLTAVLALNISLHPRLAPMELVYPGAVAQAADAPPHTLNDVLVEADEERHRLVLRSARDGGPVELVPMSSLFPTAAPPLYRFLCALAPTHAVRRGWWRLAWPPGGPDGTPGYLPRLTLDGLVLDRRAWRFPSAQVAALGEAETVEGMLAVLRWRRRLGIGAECFFTVEEPEPDEPGDWVARTARWARRARRARLRKRHYVDFDSPLLASAFLRQAGTTGGTVVVEEALPGTPHDGAGAVEYLVEYRAR